MPELGDGIWVRFKGDVSDLMSKVNALPQQIAGPLSQISDNVSKIASGFNLTALSAGAISLGASLTENLSLPIQRIKDESLNAFAGFEASMNRVQAMSGETKASLEGLKQQAMDLGSTTQFSSSKIAEAMGDLASAGLNVKEIYQAMPGVLDFAAAGQMKLADASKVATQIMHEFGMGASDMGKIADTIAYAASRSSAEVSDMGVAFQYFGPIARVANISLQQTAAAFEILADAGVKGSKAGTAMREMVSRLENPSTKAAEAMERLGISVKDAQGSLLPLDQLIGNLAPLLTNTGDGFQIFGRRFSEVLALLQAGPDKFRAMTAAAEQADNASRKMASTLMQGYTGELKKFNDELDTMKVRIGEAFAPAATAALKNIGEPLVKMVSDLAGEFGKLPIPVQQAGLALAGIAQGAGPAIAMLGQLGLALPLLQQGWAALAGAAGSLASALTANLVPALTLLGNAAVIAAAAFAAWKLGQWLYENVGWIKTFGDALSGLIEKIPLLNGFTAWATGQTAANRQVEAANQSLAASVDMLEKKLAAKGVTVDRAGLSLEQYSAKLRQAAVEYRPVNEETTKAEAGTRKVAGAYDETAAKATAAAKAVADHARAASAAAMEQANALARAQQAAAALQQTIATANSQVQAVLSGIPAAVNSMMSALSPQMNVSGPFQAITQQIQAIQGEVAKLTQQFGDHMPAAIKGNIVVLQMAADQMISLRAAAQDWKSAMDGIDTEFQSLDENIRASGEHTADFSSALSVIGQVNIPEFQELKSAIGGVSGKLDEGTEATGRWQGTTTNFANSFASSFENMVTKNLTDAIIGVRSFGQAFEDIGKRIAEYFIGNVLKSLFENFGNLGQSLTGLGNQVKSLYEGIVRLFGGINSAVGGANPTLPGIGSTGGGESGSFIPGVNMISSLVSAVANVVNAVQGHQMGIDIGRIEVTSRAQLNQLLSIQASANQWWPFLKNTWDIMMDLKTISFTTDAIRGIVGAASGQDRTTYTLLDLRNALMEPLTGIVRAIDYLHADFVGGGFTTGSQGESERVRESLLDIWTELKIINQFKLKDALLALDAIYQDIHRMASASASAAVQFTSERMEQLLTAIEQTMSGTVADLLGQVRDAVWDVRNSIYDDVNEISALRQQSVVFLQAIAESNIAIYNSLNKLGNGVDYLARSNSSNRSSNVNITVQSNSLNPYTQGQQIANGYLNQLNGRI